MVKSHEILDTQHILHDKENPLARFPRKFNDLLLQKPLTSGRISIVKEDQTLNLGFYYYIIKFNIITSMASKPWN